MLVETVKAPVEERAHAGRTAQKAPAPSGRRAAAVCAVIFAEHAHQRLGLGKQGFAIITVMQRKLHFVQTVLCLGKRRALAQDGSVFRPDRRGRRDECDLLTQSERFIPAHAPGHRDGCELKPSENNASAVSKMAR